MQKYSRRTLLAIDILANLSLCGKKTGESRRQFAEITRTWFSRWPVAHFTRQRLSTTVFFEHCTNALQVGLEPAENSRLTLLIVVLLHEPHHTG